MQIECWLKGSQLLGGSSLGTNYPTKAGISASSFFTTISNRSVIEVNIRLGEAPGTDEAHWTAPAFTART